MVGHEKGMKAAKRQKAEAERVERIRGWSTETNRETRHE
jgi:hypothetical protein